MVCVVIFPVAYRHRHCGTDARDLLASAVGKSPSLTDTAAAAPATRDWEYNHAHHSRRVIRVDTSSPAVVRTFTPLILAISACSRVIVVLNTTTKLFFMNIKSSNHFCTHHLSVGFLVELPTFARALSAPCALRTRVLGLESADRALHLHSLALWRILRFGNCTIAAVPPSHFIVPRVPLLFMSSIVLTVSQPVHFPIRPGTYHGCRHSAAVFPLLVLCAHNLCFFDVGSFCAASAFFARLRRLPARFWSYQNTCRSSPTCWAMRGIIFIHFAGVAPFPLQSSLLRDVSRLALVWRREKTLFRTVPRIQPLPPAMPHVLAR